MRERTESDYGVEELFRVDHVCGESGQDGMFSKPGVREMERIS